jgi:hypothetical protein
MLPGAITEVLNNSDHEGFLMGEELCDVDTTSPSILYSSPPRLPAY